MTPRRHKQKVEVAVIAFTIVLDAKHDTDEPYCLLDLSARMYTHLRAQSSSNRPELGGSL